MIKYFHNQKCGGCGNEYLYAMVSQAKEEIEFRKCCMCNKVVVYFIHHESDSVFEADTADDVNQALQQGCEPITYHQFWSFNMGLGL